MIKHVGVNILSFDLFNKIGDFSEYIASNNRIISLEFESGVKAGTWCNLSYNLSISLQ
jgi:hypothetical protein